MKKITVKELSLRLTWNEEMIDEPIKAIIIDLDGVIFNNVNSRGHTRNEE